MRKIRVGVVGGAGYAGGELLRLLPEHPGVEITVVTSETQAGQKLSSLYPNMPGGENLVFRTYRKEEIAAECDFVFLAKPHPNSFGAARDFFGRLRIIDLSGDFRFRRPDDFKRWYGHEHGAPELLPESVYGLPELNADRIRTARLLANPGCYPTGVLLGVLPLALAGRLGGTVNVSAVSGFSGAGRTPSPNSMAWSVVENIRAYRVGVHPHAGEMQEAADIIAGTLLEFNFVPQVAGFERGIISVVFLRTRPESLPEEEARSACAEFYRDAPFTRVCPAGVFPELKTVRGTNFCDLGLRKAGDGTLVIITAIDNLVKGAAGQAIQNMNLMAGCPETDGLLSGCS